MTRTDVALVINSHARLRPALARLTDDDARGPSRLPGWTVGHLLTHLARNADSHVRMLEAAQRGEVADQYAGGNVERAADIEAGSSRPAAELVADVLASMARLEQAWGATPDEAWRTGQGRAAGGIWPLADLPFRRWREVEIHHVDLGLGYGPADWPDAYVEVELARSLAGLPGRLAAGEGIDIRATDTGERWLVPDGCRRAGPSPARGGISWPGWSGAAATPASPSWAPGPAEPRISSVAKGLSGEAAEGGDIAAGLG